MTNTPPPRNPKPRPSGSPNSLAFRIGVPLAELQAYADSIPSLYRTMDTRPTHGGKWRHIDSPTKPFKKVQRAILKHVLNEASFPDGAFGAVRGRSCLDHAAAHLQAAHLITLDVKSCFPSTTVENVRNALARELNITGRLLDLLVALTTFRGHLPQGAPTSPAIANLVLKPAFLAIRRAAEARGGIATIYIDDLAISTPEPAPDLADFAAEQLHALDYAISNRKKHLFGPADIKVITGLDVTSNQASVALESIDNFVRDIEQRLQTGPLPLYYESRISGFINYVGSVSEDQAAVLQSGLDDLEIVFDPDSPRRRPPSRMYRHCRGGRRCRAP